MEKVEVFPVNIKGGRGYDVRVNDSCSTVQDYIDAVDRFIEQEKFLRLRNPSAGSCYGCNLCCQERIPLTVIDAKNISNTPLEETVEKLFHVYIDGRVVDITMSLDSTGRCTFLDKNKGLCTIYDKRPMVCRTYICCPATSNARLLREEIVNSGEDELVREWFNLKGKNRRMIIHEAYNPEPDITDYPPTPFKGKTSYSQVKLKDVCSQYLWRKIYRKTVPEK